MRRIIDTNVLVALIVDDRLEQRTAALTWAEQADSEGENLLVTESVLVEACWVLEHSYGLSRREVGEAVALILLSPPFRAWDSVLVEAALSLMSRRPTLSITDCLLAERAAREGALILTFDATLVRGLKQT